MAKTKIFVVARAMRREVAFTRESTMLIHELPYRVHSPCVSTRIAGPLIPSLLPGVITSAHQIPAVRLRSTHSKYTRARSQ